MKLIGLSGSLRRGSYNTALLRAAALLAPDGVELEVASLHGIPLYDGDVEAGEGLPAAVVALKEKIAAAAGLVLAIPEYNSSIPGVLKNGIDWLTRPVGDIARVFGGRPVGLVGTGPGGGGARMGHAACLPIVSALGMLPWLAARLQVANARQAFAADGALTDDKVKEQVRAYLAGFAAFVGRVGGFR